MMQLASQPASLSVYHTTIRSDKLLKMDESVVYMCALLVTKVGSPKSHIPYYGISIMGVVLGSLDLETNPQQSWQLNSATESNSHQE